MPSLARRVCSAVLLAGLLLPGCGDEPDAPAKDAPVARGETQGTTNAGLERPPARTGVRDYTNAAATKIRLTDVSTGSGIDAVNHSGRRGIKEFLIEAVGPGAAWLDYDGDGLLDLYVPDGDVLSNYTFEMVAGARGRQQHPLLRPKPERPERFGDHLYRNMGDGTFTDVTGRAGILDEAWSFGATAFDLEGDGDTDIYVSNFGYNRLWRNEGDGTFTDVAEALGVRGPLRGWSTCAAVGDLDSDGRVDLYVAQYADPAYEVQRQRAKRQLGVRTPVEAITGRDCTWRGLRAYCGPRGLEGQDDFCLRQKEDGTFEDMTKAWGMIPRVAKYAFTTLLFDFNDDGLLDIYVANDSEENFMWQQTRKPDGTIRFRDTSDTLGIKYGHGLDAQASMGATAGDFNRDGRFDIFITNFSYDFNNIFLGHRTGGNSMTFFKDRGLQVMGQAVFYDLSWGCGWFDFDNDADLDLFFGNGHVYKEADLFERTGASYEQLNSLFECMNAEKLGYREVGEKGALNAPEGVDPKSLFAGDAMKLKACTRGVAFADWNNDGRMDMFLQNLNATGNLIRNDSSTGKDAQWIKVLLRQPGGDREALGASVLVKAGGVSQRFVNMRQSSFLGTNDARIHVGLGSAETCSATVTWPGPDRATTTFENLESGGLYLLDRASGRAERMVLPAVK